MGWDWVHFVRRTLTGLFYQPRTMVDECGTVGGMRTGRGNQSTRRKSAPVPLFPPQIPYDLTWTRTRAPEICSVWEWAKGHDGNAPTSVSDSSSKCEPVRVLQPRGFLELVNTPAFPHFEVWSNKKVSDHAPAFCSVSLAMGFLQFGSLDLDLPLYVIPVGRSRSSHHVQLGPGAASRFPLLPAQSSTCVWERRKEKKR
jgi:hypothetical protein